MKLHFQNEDCKDVNTGCKFSNKLHSYPVRARVCAVMRSRFAVLWTPMIK